MLTDGLYSRAKTCPESVAFISRNNHYSYDWFALKVNRLAVGLRAHGICAGDRVALHMTNIPELLVSYYACFRIGAIAAPLNIRCKTAELRSLLERLRPAIYLGEAQLYPQVATVESEILAEGARFVVGIGENAGAQDWDRLLDDTGLGMDFNHPDAGELAVLLATSGTTGEPKFVVHTHATLSAFSKITGHLGVDREDVAIIAMPLVHIAALVSSIFCIESGAPIALFERFDADTVLAAISVHRCSWMIGTPAMFAQMLIRQRADSRDVSTLRSCRSVGDVCSLEIQRAFSEVFGLPLRTFWGSTETGAFAYGLELGPVSRIPPELEVRVVDDCGMTVPDGEVGEMLVLGPSVTPGYWIEPGRIQDPKSDGWFPTGDLVRKGDGDDVWFVGRKKDLIVRAGSNISPVEVEQVLLGHPAIRDAAVFGIPDEIEGQKVAALIHLASDARENAIDDIEEYARRSLADYKIPESIHIVHEIPRNALGKVDRKALQTLVLSS
ncbi:acyl-CoA synthetase (AMP-forming)/AMP-acid ligase II [Inquilinus ginsengisoli]|uniref:Acyl-CoA synthetase (AMP-forming)/AMP-acid ligase II n=1 Tax=Inquilinus ginsengisoli TaxID=363840 RepID=A0ABU1JKX3_9PROT|nr:class I adenylate-forming enzyme family protein [Inquilinus ginsengisoli]MDR6288199.1 acyl-CoA synthetase (AMP-forming)/AMP-acid ligase II [Inquilinus ginsengisoli]